MRKAVVSQNQKTHDRIKSFIGIIFLINNENVRMEKTL